MRLVLLALLVGLGGCDGSYISNSPGDPGSGGGGDQGGGDDTTGGGSGGGGSTGGGSGGGGAPVADFEVSLDTPMADLALGETTQVAVSVRSINDFAGDVTLTTVGLPESWQVTFTPSATVSVTAGGSGSATAIVTIPTDADPATADVQVTGTAAPGMRSATISILVRPELIIRIPKDALNNPSTAFGGTVTVRYLAPGTRVIWVNDDDTTHRIHATDGTAGLAHEDDQMLPNGGSYEVTIIQPGTYDYSCHIHPQMVGRLVVTETP